MFAGCKRGEVVSILIYKFLVLILTCQSQKFPTIVLSQKKRKCYPLHHLYWLCDASPQVARDRGAVPEACERDWREHGPWGGRRGCDAHLQLLGVEASRCTQQATVGATQPGCGRAYATTGASRSRQDEDVCSAAPRSREGIVTFKSTFLSSSKVLLSFLFLFLKHARYFDKNKKFILITKTMVCVCVCDNSNLFI